MTTTILLARHGQTDSNINGFYMGWSEQDLNEEGYRQAKKLADRLAARPLAAIYTSPLKRTRSTATVIAERHKLELNPMDDLIEVNLGDWQGLHIDEIRQGWPELWKQWRSDPSDVTVPGGESFKKVYERAVRAFKQIVLASRDKTALIVTHDIIVKMIVIHAINAPTGIYRRFNIDNASLSTVELSGNNLKLTRLNDTSHLE